MLSPGMLGIGNEGINVFELNYLVPELLDIRELFNPKEAITGFENALIEEMKAKANYITEGQITYAVEGLEVLSFSCFLEALRPDLKGNPRLEKIKEDLYENNIGRFKMSLEYLRDGAMINFGLVGYSFLSIMAFKFNYPKEFNDLVGNKPIVERGELSIGWANGFFVYRDALDLYFAFPEYEDEIKDLPDVKRRALELSYNGGSTDALEAMLFLKVFFPETFETDYTVHQRLYEIAEYLRNVCNDSKEGHGNKWFLTKELFLWNLLSGDRFEITNEGIESVYVLKTDNTAQQLPQVRRF